MDLTPFCGRGPLARVRRRRRILSEQAEKTPLELAALERLGHQIRELSRRPLEGVFGQASVGRPAWTSTREPAESESVGCHGRDSDGGTRLRSR
jgi:hypothetical protein